MARTIRLKEQNTLERWTIESARDLYNIDHWSKGFFGINKKGNLVVHPDKSGDKYLDMKDLLDDVRMRNLTPPVLFRFTDVLKRRIEDINAAFHDAIEEYGYEGEYRGVYPIKVNQSKDVVEEIIECGAPHCYGLEAGSKAELLITIATLTTPDAPIICNGYKDDEYIELALWARKLGRNVIIVVEKLSELGTIINISKKLKVTPTIGIRAKLVARGRGKWESSGGDRSKFGLFPSEILAAIETLKQHDMMASFQLVHFHLGSQITTIQSIKEALRESTQIFSELVRLGVGIKYFDVGGGLAVDYDGSKTNFSSSANYTLGEYAADVVSALADICEERNLPQPTIISESGRALVAYHSVLVFNVLGTSELGDESSTIEMPEQVTDSVAYLHEILETLSVKNFQEAYHDALQSRDEALTLFNIGMLTLEERALMERLFWRICRNIAKIIQGLDYVPDELESLTHFVSLTYYGNLSVFQSLPDHWAVKQLFPVMPIHRLNERPTKQATIADITCDSDGKVDQFIDLRDMRNTLPLHEFHQGKPYYLGVFLVGAYQEVLGDLHNLFGDTHTVHVSVTGPNEYAIDRIVEGDTVSEVLSYMEYSKKDILNLVRAAVERAIQDKRISIKESAKLKKFMEDGLEGYTYLE